MCFVWGVYLLFKIDFFMKIIDEIKKITADQVAKKQDVAKLNYPKIIDKIKAQAALGFSSAKFPIYKINEYDKKLLEQEGFHVWLSEEETKYNDYKSIGYKPSKVWEISW